MTPNDSGFSLLETMIALAILSIASLVLFQSTGSMLRMSDRSVKVGENIIDHALRRGHVETLVTQLVPSWSHGEEPAFIGDEDQFSGISRMISQANKSHFSHFTLQLDGDSDGKLKLNLQLNDEVWSLQAGVLEGSKFNYLTPTNVWVSKWPPDTKHQKYRKVGDKDFLAQYDLKLPTAIRLVDSEGRIVWVIPIPDSQNIPEKVVDFETF